MTINDILSLLDEFEVNYTFYGNRERNMKGISSLYNYKKDTLTWIKTKKVLQGDLNYKDIALAIVDEQVDVRCENTIITKESKVAFFICINYFLGKEKQKGIGENSYISDKVILGENVFIGNNCTLDGNIIIGNGTMIDNNVVIMGNVMIGNDCHIQDGVIIGNEGLAQVIDKRLSKIYCTHIGGVQIGDRVHINANCEINRGVIDNTIICDDVSMSGGCIIGHNSYIGRMVTLAPRCVVCGSVSIGENSYISGAMIKNQCKIGKNVVVGFGSVVVTDIDDGKSVLGYPAQPTFIKAL